ncbi:unnamed protein product [Mesocestoides corti]|uniref:Neuropeptide n=1 Tax=Mesocestoides corti TaxID=53468 RepID=A0A0R3UCK5_MESCO|nr:unnamed protein product [Mesocestoides corti]
MYQRAVGLVLALAIVLNLPQTPTGYQLHDFRFSDVLQPDVEGMAVDDRGAMEEDVVDVDPLRQESTKRLNWGFPVRPKKFGKLKDREKFVAALNTYYMLFGRPRQVP